MNRYTKYVRYISAKKTWTIENLIDVFMNEIFTKYERSIFITIDRDLLFISNFWLSLCYHLWIKLRYSTAYHSQTNEQIKRQNQILESYLRCYINYQQNNWTQWLSITEFVYNNNIHAIIDKSFFELMFDAEVK